MAPGSRSEPHAPDSTMHKQASYFGTATLYRDVMLTGVDEVSSKAARELENQAALGGMRRPDLSVQAHDRYRQPGQLLWVLLARYVTDNPDLLQVVEDLRKGCPGEGFALHHLHAVRRQWLLALRAHPTPPRHGPDPDVLQAWGRATGDPDAAEVLPNWLRQGAPLGIHEKIDITWGLPSHRPH